MTEKHWNPEYKNSLQDAINKSILEWEQGARWPRDFNISKWEMSEDRICGLHTDCNDCFIADVSGAPNCEATPIAEAIGAYYDVDMSGDGYTEDEWSKSALAVSEFFELSLIELMKGSK